MIRYILFYPEANYPKPIKEKKHLEPLPNQISAFELGHYQYAKGYNHQTVLQKTIDPEM